MNTRAYAVIARSVRFLWLGSVTSGSKKAFKPDSDRTVDRETAVPRYSFTYTNGTETLEDTRRLEFSTDRAARREALRTAREMANNVSWQSSAGSKGWTVLVTNPIGQQICEVPVRFNQT